MTFCSMIFAGIPVFAQEALYPVPVNRGLGTMSIEASSQEGRPVFTAEKPLEYKLKLGFPTSDQAGFIRDTKANVIVFWLRIENLSRHAMEFKTDNFTVTDKDGQAYTSLAPGEAFDRIVAGAALTGKIIKKGLRGVSLGRVASKDDQDEDREEAVRFSLQAGQIPALGFKQGLIYFEAPQAKTYTVNVSLGDLWLKPFIFTNTKPKK